MIKHLLLLSLFSLFIFASPTPPENDLFGGFNLPDSGEDLLSNVRISDSQFDALQSQFNISNLPIEAKELEKRDTVDILRYAITIDGRNIGNIRNWVVSGELYVTSRIASSGTQNGANAAEFLLLVGNPAGNPVAGAVRYYTNRYLYKLTSGKFSAARLDYAYVTRSGNTYRIRPDPRIAAANQLSVFTQTTGLLASIFLVGSGEMVVNIATNRRTLSGTINFGGRGFIFPGRGVERGRIQGRLIGSGRRTF